MGAMTVAATLPLLLFQSDEIIQFGSIVQCEQQATPQSSQEDSKPSVEDVSNDDSQKTGLWSSLRQQSDQILKVISPAVETDTEEEKDNTTLFHGLFPLRQLWKPRLEYPMWDFDWDGRELKGIEDEKELLKQIRQERQTGVTRHIILVRHGQYDESSSQDERRKLTELGRQQAHLTGQRIAQLIASHQDDEKSPKATPCRVSTLRVSNMTRAKETADIIGQYLPSDVLRAEPDELLNERRPCHVLPSSRSGRPASSKLVAQVDESRPIMEEAFAKYFYRSTATRKTTNSDNQSTDDNKANESNESNKDKSDNSTKNCKHEFEIIVCHGNVIRYFFCRALQLPPEAWLRLTTFNCSLTYLIIRPGAGTVSCRMLGDTGHLPYSHTTFSNHHGYNW